jgi:short-subunit dehydrogenase
MIERLVFSGMGTLATDILLNSLRKLSKKYSIDVKYVLSEKIEAEFQKCLDIAIKAFLEFVYKNADLQEAQQKIIFEYLKSSVVPEEIWHLLDPGSEIFLL